MPGAQVTAFCRVISPRPSESRPWKLLLKAVRRLRDSDWRMAQAQQVPYTVRKLTSSSFSACSSSFS